MTKRTGPLNIVLRKTADEFVRLYKSTGSGLWRDVAEHLIKPTRKRVVVNVSKINRYADEGDIIVVPGKVLGSGRIEKKVTVAAFAFSDKAIEKIRRAGGKTITLSELVRDNVEPKNVKLLV